MGVKIKLADAREVGGVKRKAGDVIEVDNGEGRVLLAVGAGVKVDNRTKTTTEKSATAADGKAGDAGRKG